MKKFNRKFWIKVLIVAITFAVSIGLVAVAIVVDMFTRWDTSVEGKILLGMHVIPLAVVLWATTQIKKTAWKVIYWILLIALSIGQVVLYFANNGLSFRIHELVLATISLEFYVLCAVFFFTVGWKILFWTVRYVLAAALFVVDIVLFAIWLVVTIVGILLDPETWQGLSNVLMGWRVKLIGKRSKRVRL